MAKKKEEQKKEDESAFDFEEALSKLEVPEMLKAGFKYYILVNNIEIQSENELEKQLDKFKVYNAGA